jgi:hypothetical protein
MIKIFSDLIAVRTKFLLLMFLTFSLLVVLTFQVSAQGKKSLQFSLGTSPQVSWLKSDYSNVENEGIRLGIGFGLKADYYFTDNYAFSSGLMIVNSGGRLKYLDTNIGFKIDGSTLVFNTDPTLDGVTMTYKLQFVEIPLLLKMRTNEISGKTFYGLFGLSAQMNIQAKGEANQLSVNDARMRDEVNFLNVGYQIGGGVEYELGKNLGISGGLSFFNGFSDITTDDSGRKSDKITQRSLIIHLSVLF